VDHVASIACYSVVSESRDQPLDREARIGAPTIRGWQSDLSLNGAAGIRVREVRATDLTANGNG
jgi:hypothetical protein